MKSRIILLIMSAMLIMPATASGQVTNLLKKKKNVAKKSASKTANKEVDKEIDKRVTKGVLKLRDRLLGAEQEDTTAVQGAEGSEGGVRSGGNAGVRSGQRGQGGSNPFAALMGGGADVPHKDRYDFNTRIVMDMEGTDPEEGPGKVRYTSWFNTTNGDFAISFIASEEDQNASITMVYDEKNTASIIMTLAEGQKTAIITKGDEESLDMEDTESASEGEAVETDYKYVKTGRTKNIAGYKCNEYLVTDDQDEVHLWVTSDLKLKMKKKELEKAGVPIYYGGPIDGMILGEEVFRDGEKKMTLTTVEVDLSNKEAISLDGYTIMGVNFDNMK